MENKLNKEIVIKKPNKFEFRYTHYGSGLIQKILNAISNRNKKVYGHAIRSGKGEGNAYRLGEGIGNAYRLGEGNGDAVRSKKSCGSVLHNKNRTATHKPD